MQPRQPATRAEARALAHPLRLRINRLTRDRALTISELSEILGLGKATVLHHVRTLLREGFLAAEPPRRSAAGRTEKPYRSTAKSLAITLTDVPEFPIAALDAFRAEVAGHHDPSPMVVRRQLRLDADAHTEFVDRLSRLVDEFDARSDPAGPPVNVLAIAVTDLSP